MPTLTYNLKNGLVFATVEGLEGYIRGLELVRHRFGESLTGEPAAEFATWLDDAHSVKAAGPTDPNAVPAKPAPEAEAEEKAA